MTFFFCRWCFWFRIFGYGLHIKLAKGHRPLFSERFGHRKAHYLLGLLVEVLRPRKRESV